MMPADIIEDSSRCLRNAIPVGDDLIESEYLEDFALLEKQVGKKFYSNFSEGGENFIQHIEIVKALGAEAINIVEDTSYRFWSESADKSYLEWCRLVWRYLLVAPLGFISANRQVTNYSGKQTWCPAFRTQESFGAIRVSESNRQISGTHLGLAMYMRIFPDSVNGKVCGQMASAIVDAFDPLSVNDNPIRNAAKRGIKRRMERLREHTLPYWWVDFINTLFEKDETFRPISEFEQLHNQEKVAFERQTNIVQMVNKSDVEKPRKVDYSESIKAISKKQQSASSDDTAELARSWLIKKFSTKEFSVNKKGARGHIYRRRLWVVSPFVFDTMAVELKIDKDLLVEKLIKEEMIVSNQGKTSHVFEIHSDKGKQIGKCHMTALGKVMSESILNVIDESDDNKAFHIIT